MTPAVERAWDGMVAKFVFGRTTARRRTSQEAANAKRQGRDAEWVSRLEAVTDPVEALRIIVKNERFLTLNSEYTTRRAGLLAMADRIAKAARRK